MSLTNLSVRKRKTTVRNLLISSVRPKEVSKIQEEMAPRKPWEKTRLAKTPSKTSTTTAFRTTVAVFTSILAKKLTNNRRRLKLKIIRAPRVVAAHTRSDPLKFIIKQVNYWRIDPFLESRRGKFLLFPTRWINHTKTSSDSYFKITNHTNIRLWVELVGVSRHIPDKN